MWKSKLERASIFTIGRVAVVTVYFVSRLKRTYEQLSETAGKALAAYRARSSVDEPQAVQNARATQPGRGRTADSPFSIPWLGWQDILWRTWIGISEDHLLTLAGGVAFFALLALVPALTAAVSSYALFADAHAIQDQLNLASYVVPPSALDIIRDEVARIAAHSDGRLTLSFLGGLGLSLWSANAAIKALFEAFNIVYAEGEKRDIITLNLFSLFVTICGIAGALLVISAVVVVPLALAMIGFPSLKLVVIAYMRWPIMLVLAMVALAILYRHGPSRRLARPRWVTCGSLTAALAWLVMSAAFSWYLSHAANYTATYGALGAVIGMMMWMWLSAVVILVGAKLNAEIEHQTAIDSTVGPTKPLGERGAVMADTVGPGVA
jgi:membrane protein